MSEDIHVLGTKVQYPTMRPPSASRPATLHRSPYLYSGEADTSSGVWPDHILSARQPRYHWSGVGPLSIKTFHTGTAHYRVGDGGACRVDDTCFLLLNAGQSYAITIDSPEPVESFCLFFSIETVASAWRLARETEDHLLDDPAHIGESPDFYERTYLHDNLLSPALFGLRKTIRSLPAGVTPDPLWVAEQMCGVLEQLIRQQGRTREEVRSFTAGGMRFATREETYRRLYRARDFMAASYAEPVTLAQIAAIACLSPNHFLRTFKAAFGVSPHQYLTERRIEAARLLLRNTEIRVTDICLQVGFQSLGSFSYLFTRRVGLSPDAYRNLTTKR